MRLIFEGDEVDAIQDLIKTLNSKIVRYRKGERQSVAQLWESDLPAQIS